MKSWIFTFLLFPLVFVACADKKNDNQVATVPVPAPPTACVDGTTYCNSNQFANYPGYSAYPGNPYYYNMNYGWGGSGYVGRFCNCPAGSRPVYNGQYGLGCVSVNAFNPYAGGAVYWGYGTNNQWVTSQAYPQQSGCYQNVAQTCFVDQVGSCGPNYTCQTTGGASRMGICVAQGATNPNATGTGYR